MKTLLVLASMAIGCATMAAHSGTINVVPSPREAGWTTGSGTYSSGSVITIGAYASNNWMFSRWQDNDTNAVRQLVVKNGKRFFTATFTNVPPVVYGTIQLVAEPINGGSVSGAGTYPVGQLVNINATPFPNWSFTQWQDGNLSSNRSITVPQGTVLMSATFLTNAPPYGTLSTVASPVQGGTVTGGGSYVAGMQTTITASPNVYWRFDGWQDGNTNASRLVTVQAGTKTYTAYFTEYGTLQVTAEPHDGGTVTGGGTYKVGQSVVINATPSVNWLFIRWQDGDTNTTRQLVILSGVVQMTATFMTNQPSKGNANLRWKKVNDPGLKKYIAYWGNSSLNYTGSVSTTGTNVLIMDLTASVPYYFSVKSVSTNDLISLPSCELVWQYPGVSSCP